MTNVTIYRQKDGSYQGFDCDGHSGYADAGEDIVCAGVSALVINTINSIMKLTETKLDTYVDEEKGTIRVRVLKEYGEDAELLIESLILGIKGISENYGEEFIILNFKEV
ncbi:MAG: ribosomal-processing cysteine protease Prp [Lachnospiraceae bacterium]|nr:ribosomal-processing cysteine protease Prp [Lachnospiraceae bacterium]